MRTSLLLALGAAGVLASPAHDTTLPKKRALEPCAQVADSLPQGRSGQQQKVNATTALACLRSVPLDTERNPDLLKAIRATMQFQSDLNYLKNPPPGSLYPAVDILGGLDDISNKLNSNYYKNEYDFQFDLHALGKSSHDYHFNLKLDITQVFSWQRDDSLISVSKDGLSLPEVYLVSDSSAFLQNSTPPAVSKINGVDVQTWINNVASRDPYDHDPDVNYNAVLYRQYLSARNQGRFQKTYFPQGDETIITYQNGTEKKVNNFAVTTEDFTGVVDGATFFKKFCTGQIVSNANGGGDADPDPVAAGTTTSFGRVSTSLRATSTSTSSNRYPPLVSFAPVATQSPAVNITATFPRPLIISTDFTVAGFLPDDRKDLAVLVMPSFDSKNAQEFQNVVRKFLATAQAQKRTKLVIDIRGNDGGKIYLGVDTFRQLFPSIMPFGASQSRSHPLYRDLVNIYTNYYNSTQALSQSGRGSPFNILNSVDADGKAFPSTSTFYGPYFNYGENYTALERRNLSRTGSTGPVEVYGFGSNTARLPQVFQPENMVILSDGACGSTCAIFSEFMKAQAGVKSIAVGGRKQNGPMQAVGGTKGAEVISVSDLSTHVRFAQTWAKYASNTTFPGSAAELLPGLENLLARSRKNNGVRVNTRNNIRQNDTTLTPLQFVYEAADCRFFYTYPMLTKQSLAWNMAADIHWGNATCVPGSSGHPTSLSGTLVGHLRDDPPTGANYTFDAPDKPFPSGVNNPASTVGASDKPTLAPTTGSSVFDQRTTYIPSFTSTVAAPSTTVAASTTIATTASTTSSSASASTSSAKPTNAATRQSAGVVSFSVLAALLASCLL